MQTKHKPRSNANYHLTPGEVLKLIKAASSSRNRAIIRVFAETGLRRSELAALKVGDVDSVRNTITVQNGKNDKRRVVPATDSLLDLLKKLSADDSHAPLFRSRSGGHLSPRQINRIVADAGVRAQVKSPNPHHPTVTCHLLRHTFARLWKANNGSIESLSRIMGHESVKTTWDLYGNEGLQDVKRNYQTTIKRMYKTKGNLP